MWYVGKEAGVPAAFPCLLLMTYGPSTLLPQTTYLLVTDLISPLNMRPIRCALLFKESN